MGRKRYIVRPRIKIPVVPLPVLILEFGDEVRQSDAEHNHDSPHKAHPILPRHILGGNTIRIAIRIARQVSKHTITISNPLSPLSHFICLFSFLFLNWKGLVLLKIT